jgi:hypothetical protein
MTLQNYVQEIKLIPQYTITYPDVMERSNKELKICHSYGFRQVQLKRLEWTSEPHQTNCDFRVLHYNIRDPLTPSI